MESLKRTRKREAPVNQGRHEARAVCKHARWHAIENEFVAWNSPKSIAKDHTVCRDSLYRHAQVSELLEPRGQNVRAGEDELIIAKQRAGGVGSERVHFDSRTLSFGDANMILERRALATRSRRTL